MLVSVNMRLLLSAKGEAPIKLVSEQRTLGLARVLLAECQGCRQTFTFETSPKLPHSRIFDINVRAVWGSIVTGNEPAHMNEFLATLDSPGMSQTSFSSIEEEIGEWWKNALQTELLLAGAEERQIAINKGNYHGDVPSITVIADGGWSKRTHKHSYNALGGVAIIIGQETKKLLHIGVRNKYCYICNSAQQKQQPAKLHKCFKNWNDSSQSMEADIIVEGFCQSESKHGVRYMRLIGDGDSSVFARTREQVPIWGKDVEKLECSNHACKCVRSKFVKLVAENPAYKGKHHLIKVTRVRIVSSIRCAIRMRTNEATSTGNRQLAVTNLKRDIIQSVYHVFGHHDNCSDFCKAKPKADTASTSSTEVGSSQLTVETVEDVINDQVKMWSEGSSVTAQDESRLGTSTVYSKVEKFILQDVSNILSTIADKSSRLIGCMTTNLAESWMHIRSKFDGGKVYNLCNRGSWHGRCYGGALRMNLGPQWSPKMWKMSTATEPGKKCTSLYEKRERLHINTTVHKSKPETKAKRWKRKISSGAQSNTKKARLAYGPEALDVSNDVIPSKLDDLQNTFIETNINLTCGKIKEIEKATLHQSQSGLWHDERRKRLTASNFGPNVRRNPYLPVLSIVRKHLYNKFQGNRYTKNGLLQEHNTLEEYKLKKAEENMNVEIEPVGLVIDKKYTFLGGSPDGKVCVSNGDVGLVEVKNVLYNKALTLYQAAENQKQFCLEIQDGKLSLREQHDYLFQCHGLLNVCDYPWIDLVVRTCDPYQLHIQRIDRNKEFWERNMLPKLTDFYHKVLLPELTLPREKKSPGIREPGIWYVDSTSKIKPTIRSRCKTPTDDGFDSTVRNNAANRNRPSLRKGSTKTKNASSGRRSSTDAANIVTTPSLRSTSRVSKVKFVGRSIKHQWIIDEATDQRDDWYKGTVLSVISGVDGEGNAVYEIVYQGEQEPVEVDHLLEDFRSSSLIFIDV